jgi:hypothetical protein
MRESDDVLSIQQLLLGRIPDFNFPFDFEGRPVFPFRGNKRGILSGDATRHRASHQRRYGCFRENMHFLSPFPLREIK